MKNTCIKKISSILVFILFPCILSAQSASYFLDFLRQVSDIVNSSIPVLITLALLYFLWGLVMFIQKSGEGGAEEGRDKMLWGVIGLFVILSVWGLVALVQSLTGISDTGAFTLPSVL